MSFVSPSSSSSSSSAVAAAAASNSSLVTLFHILPATVICAFLHTTDVLSVAPVTKSVALLRLRDLLSVASIDRATRRLLLSSPAVWRTKVFTSVAPPPSAPISAALPSWCLAVQLVKTWGVQPGSGMPEGWSVEFAHLARYPNLRRIHATWPLTTHYGGGGHKHDDDSARVSPSPSLSSMRRLTRISLDDSGALSVDDMRLLITLPVLASFAVRNTSFASGNESTLRQWQALTASNESRRSAKRKAELLAENEQHGKREEGDEESTVEAKQHEEETDDEDGEPMGPEASMYWGTEDPNDANLPLKHSALLLFLHALASKPSFVHLELVETDLTPFVLDHMPVWPHLLSLDLQGNHNLHRYRFKRAASCFPSLTSLTQPNCSDAAISHLVRLPALEELRFPRYCCAPGRDAERRVLTSARGFRTFSKANKLRSIYYSPPQGEDKVKPSLAALTSVFTLANLTRLTLSATWHLYPLLSDHHFEHLRCLELIAQDGYAGYLCPQTDAVLLPLVKPLDVVVEGREERQAARDWRRGSREYGCWLDEHGNEAEEVDSAVPIPAGNAANFPSLECLALPYRYYSPKYYQSKGRMRRGEVSWWMQEQLWRSYEYEVAAEWEAECTTLGCAELLKAIMA